MSRNYRRGDYKNSASSGVGSSDTAPPGSQCSSDGVSLSERTDAVLDGLCLLLTEHKASPEIISQLRNQLHELLDTSGCEMVWLKRVKYVYTYPLAKYLRARPPPPPDQPFRPTGGLRGWMRTRLNPDVDATGVNLWFSWFQCKRSTLPLSKDIVEQNYDKHLETLTMVDHGDDATIREIFRETLFVKVLWELRSAITDAFSVSPPLEEWMASNNACFEEPRSTRGQQGCLSEEVGLSHTGGHVELKHGRLEVSSRRYSNYPLAPTFLYDMKHYPKVFTKVGVKKDLVHERRYRYGDDEWLTLEDRVLTTDMSRPLDCAIQAVLEPNKVRIISKGNALPYYSCRPLQKALHSSMKRLAPFRLIGRPFCPTDMIDLQEKATSDFEWFSVDYSAATDGLSWKYSGKILRFLLQDLPKFNKDLALSVLGPHNLYYPPKGGRGPCELRGVQQNGQLMGSILSFPILCLANFGVYCLATRETQKEWTLDERMNHVLINGDDMVYSDLPSSWDNLVSIAQRVGLEMSVGKAYVHRSYANINSTSIILPLHKEGSARTPRVVNYLNTGLYFGRHKVQGRSENAQSHDSSKEGLVGNLNTILAGARPGRECDLLRSFLAYHSNRDGVNVLMNETRVKTYTGDYFNRNLFIPIALGGMGVIPPVGWKYRISKEEVRIASGFVLQYPGVHIDSQMPLRDIELCTKLEPEVTRPWYVDLDEKLPPRVPRNTYTDSFIRHLCRIGMFRYGCRGAVMI